MKSFRGTIRLQSIGNIVFHEKGGRFLVCAYASYIIFLCKHFVIYF